MPNKDKVRTIWDIEKEMRKAYCDLGRLLAEISRMFPKKKIPNKNE